MVINSMRAGKIHKMLEVSKQEIKLFEEQIKEPKPCLFSPSLRKIFAGDIICSSTKAYMHKKVLIGKLFNFDCTEREIFAKDWDLLLSESAVYQLWNRSNSQLPSYDVLVSHFTGVKPIQFSNSMCEVCCTGEKNYALIPCGHLLCQDCLNRLTDQRVVRIVRYVTTANEKACETLGLEPKILSCPFCKAETFSSIKVYF